MSGVRCELPADRPGAGAPMTAFGHDAVSAAPASARAASPVCRLRCEDDCLAVGRHAFAVHLAVRGLCHRGPVCLSQWHARGQVAGPQLANHARHHAASRQARAALRTPWGHTPRVSHARTHPNLLPMPANFNLIDRLSQLVHRLPNSRRADGLPARFAAGKAVDRTASTATRRAAGRTGRNQALRLSPRSLRWSSTALIAAHKSKWIPS